MWTSKDILWRLLWRGDVKQIFKDFNLHATYKCAISHRKPGGLNTDNLWKLMKRAGRRDFLIFVFVPPAPFLSRFLPVLCQIARDRAEVQGWPWAVIVFFFSTNAFPFHSLFLSSLLTLCLSLGMARCTKTGDCCCCCYRVTRKVCVCVFFPSSIYVKASRKCFESLTWNVSNFLTGCPSVLFQTDIAAIS